MVVYNIHDLKIEHTFTQLDVHSVGNRVYLKVIEYDTEAEVTLSVEEASALIEFLQKFVRGKVK